MNAGWRPKCVYLYIYVCMYMYMYTCVSWLLLSTYACEYFTHIHAYIDIQADLPQVHHLLCINSHAYKCIHI
jgi:hypothetical protein